MEPKEFLTKDLWEAAVLSASGYPCIAVEYREADNCFYWVFEESVEIRNLVYAHYHRELSLPTGLLREHHLKLKTKLKAATKTITE